MARRQTETMRQQRRRQRQVTKNDSTDKTRTAASGYHHSLSDHHRVLRFSVRHGHEAGTDARDGDADVNHRHGVSGSQPGGRNRSGYKKEEDAITSLDSVDKVQSISRENVSIVIVQYEYGTNMDTAYINLKKAIDGIQGDLPDDANDPNIRSWISTRWRRLRWQSAATLIRTILYICR